MELAIEIIKDFGRPMEASLLREKIMEHRDIKANQQIHAKGELVHIDYGLYGIRKRDIELTIEEEKELFALFYLRLLIYPEGSFDGENAKAHILQTVVDFEKGETNEGAAMIIIKSIELKEILQDLENHLPQSFIDYLSGKRKGAVPKYLHEPWKDPYTGEIKYLDVKTNDIQGKEVSFLEWLNNFSLDKEWVEKHIRSKRKWSSILRKKQTKIFSIQAKIKNIETKLDIDFKKILSFAEESLDEILKLDKAYTDSRWNIGTEENLLLPEKITYYQLIRLLRMSDRFNVDISNEEYPKLSINKSSN